jgi:hypothetical protein
MLTATAQEHSARTFSRTSVDTWEATRRDRFLADTSLYPRNLLFIEELCTIPVFCSIATQTPNYILFPSAQGKVGPYLQRMETACLDTILTTELYALVEADG